MYLFVLSFVVEFIILGFTSTQIVYPLLSIKQIIKKPAYILAFSLVVSLIGILLCRYTIGLSIPKLIAFLACLSIIFIIISALNKYNQYNQENPKSLPDYINRTTPISTYAIIIYCIISLIGMVVPPFSILPLWQALCIPLVIIIPGHLIVTSLLRRHKDLEILERMVVASFTSLVITSLIGIMVLLTENVMDMKHVSIILVFLTLLILLPIYILRTRPISLKERFKYPLMDNFLIAIAIISLIIVIASGVYINTTNLADTVDNTPTVDVPTGNTTFDVNGNVGSAGEDGNFTFDNGQKLSLNVSIENLENKDTNYTLTVSIQNETVNNTIEEFNVTLADKEKEIIPVNLTMTTGQKDIVFTLYKEGQAYKILHLYSKVN